MKLRQAFPRVFLFVMLAFGLIAGLVTPRLPFVEAKPRATCADLILTEWTFSNTDVPSTGAGIFGYGAGLNNPTYYSGTARSFSSWNTPSLDSTAYVDFEVDITGRQNILLSFDYRSTSTGPQKLELHYSLDGSAYTLYASETLTNDSSSTFYPLNFNLSSIPALNNTSGVHFRMYGYAATSSAGTLAFDNVRVSGDCLFSPLTILINEVAWAGTSASPDDEWIELYNPGSAAINLNGWRLTAADGSPDILLSGNIPDNGYFLLERGSDNTVKSATADLLFTGALDDTGEILYLRAPDGSLVDSANSSGAGWDAGMQTGFRSMERIGVVADTNLAWSSFEGAPFALDAANQPINGSPGAANAMLGSAPTLTPSNTPTASLTPSNTPSPTNTATETPTPATSMLVIISEVAWAGTSSANSGDEWVELYNPNAFSVDVTGWKLKDTSTTIVLSGVIPAHGFFLLEDNESAVLDVASNQTNSNLGLSNTGETLELFDGSDTRIDSANVNGGGWPAGSSSTYGTMERIFMLADSDSAWVTNTGKVQNGENRDGAPILGTPKNISSPTLTPTRTRTPTRTPTKTRTRTPTRTPSMTRTPSKTKTPTPIVNSRPIINEFLPRPGFDWNQDGKTDVYDEFIELKNIGNGNWNTKGWKIDDTDADRSSDPFTLPALILKPGERLVFYALETNLLLSDGGDEVRLIHPNGKLYDRYSYALATVEDQSTCRLPDGNGSWYADCLPTPKLANTRSGVAPIMPGADFQSPVCSLPDTLPQDFLFAECRGYGANIWRFVWENGALYLPEANGKWRSFIR